MQLRPDLQSRVNEPWNDVRNYEMLRNPTAMFTAVQLAVRASGVAPMVSIAKALKTSGFVAALHEIALAEGTPHGKSLSHHEYVATNGNGVPYISLHSHSRPLTMSMWLARDKGVSAYLHAEGYAYQNYKMDGRGSYTSLMKVDCALLPTLANWVFENLPAARAKLADQARRVNCVPDEKAVPVPSRPAKFFNDLAQTPHARMDLLANLPHDRRQAAVAVANQRNAVGVHGIADIVRDVVCASPESVVGDNGDSYALTLPDVLLNGYVTSRGHVISVYDHGNMVFDYASKEGRPSLMSSAPWLAEFYQRWPQANSRLTSARQNLTMLGKLRFSNG